jgi:hypothetical protein
LVSDFLKASVDSPRIKGGSGKHRSPSKLAPSSYEEEDDDDSDPEDEEVRDEPDSDFMRIMRM